MSASLDPSAGQITAAIASSMPAGEILDLRDVTADEVDAVAGRILLELWMTTILVVYSSEASSLMSSLAVEFQPQTTMWSRNPAAPMPMPSLSR